jgi:hypothetical protein
MHNIPVGPEPSTKDAWRVACLAYRRVRQKGKLHQPAHNAAVKALLEVMPHLSPREASGEVTKAIHWCSVEHPKWLWSGVGGHLKSPADWPAAMREDD